MERMADLHMHTTASDGLLAPAAVVKLAAAAGLAAVAITDHDTIAGVGEAMEEGARCGILVVPGVEISTVASGIDVHVLGYNFDVHDDRFQERLRQLRQTRDRRNEMIVDKLQGLGMDISMEEVVAAAGRDGKGDDTVGRPHIAAVLIAKGYVSSIDEAFRTLLGQDGAAYVNPPRIDPATAVTWIHEAGGYAVLAHPGLYGDDSLIPVLAAAGLDGVEAYHSEHSTEQEAAYAALAKQYGLYTTAGSDFHGEREGELFHGAIGSRSVPVAGIESWALRRR